jgi:hypothetical protein
MEKMSKSLLSDFQEVENQEVKNKEDKNKTDDNTDKLGEVIRVVKRPSNFVVMDKAFLEDNNLSYKAKGILAYLLSKPDNWRVIVGDLVSCSTDGKASVYAGLKELKEHGYYEKVPIRKGNRIVKWESTIYEIPKFLLTDFKEVEKQNIGKQYTENRERNNNYINKELYINNNYVKSCQEKTDRQNNAYKDDYVSLMDLITLVKSNINYNDLLLTHKLKKGLIDEFINIILDALLTQSKTIRIGKEDKPKELVRSNLLKLTYENIEYALEKFEEVGQKIQKKHQYILTMLYYSVLEKNAHYENLVNSNM